MAGDSVTKIKKIQAQAAAFLSEKGMGIQDDKPASRSRKFAHFWLVVYKSFVRNRCPVRASALAYTTLLALIPLLAVVIGISTSFLKAQGEESIQEMIVKLVNNVAPQIDLLGRDSAPSVNPSDDNFFSPNLSDTNIVTEIKTSPEGGSGDHPLCGECAQWNLGRHRRHFLNCGGDSFAEQY